LLEIAVAQQPAKLRFHSINNVGLLEGGSDESLQLQTINGVQYRSFFGGVGIGMDNYYFKTIPLFADLRKDLFSKKQTPFIYLDLGASIPWDKTTSENKWNISHFKTGFLYDMGIGYTLPIKGRWAVNASAGFSQKFLNETRESFYWIWNDFPPYTPPANANRDTSYYNYTMRRFSFKIGISF
jgi:hypothetical protein